MSGGVTMYANFVCPFLCTWKCFHFSFVYVIIINVLSSLSLNELGDLLRRGASWCSDSAQFLAFTEGGLSFCNHVTERWAHGPKAFCCHLLTTLVFLHTEFVLPQHFQRMHPNLMYSMHTESLHLTHIRMPAFNTHLHICFPCIPEYAFHTYQNLRHHILY